MKNANISLYRAALKTSAASMVIGAAFLASPSFAQAAPPSASVETPETIVVTGSRIARPDLEQASPVAVISQEEFKLQGTLNVENVLNDLPQVVAASTGTSNNPGGGIATVDLRGLGTQRTLVLVDGRRYVSYDVNQVVDLNTIPSALIERVDVVTGGRSAVYGSDAIAGVVNFVMRHDFEGAEFNSNYELSSRGDGSRFDINGVIGTNFADGRGNVTMFVDYSKRKSIFAGQRAFALNALQDNQDGTAIFGGSSSVSQGRVNIPGLGVAAGTGNNNNDFAAGAAGATLSPYVAATDAYNYAPINYLQVPQERFLFSAQGEYEVSEAFRPYFQTQFINNRVPQQLAATPISNGTPFRGGAIGTIQLQVNSPFFSTATQAAFRALDATQTTGGTAQAPAVANDGYVNVPNFGFRTVGIGPRVVRDNRDAYRFVTGIKGDVGGGWSYDGYYMYAHTDNSQRQEGNVSITNFLAATRTAFLNPATGAVSALPIAGVAGGGTLVCSDATSRASGCVPANLFGNGNLSTAAANYLAIGATNLERYTTQVASVAITNSDLVDLGAGGVGLAIGAEYRSESGSVIPDTFLATGNVAGFNPGNPTGGRYDVREAFAELNVPIFAEQPFAYKLELNGAARYSHYSNSPGNVFTWTAGGQYAPIKDVTFRGQYARAIRGPSVNELFLGNTVTFVGGSEYCNTAAAAAAGQLRDACLATGVPAARIGDPTLSATANPTTFFGGNAALKEERSKTWSVGGVFSPGFLPGFSVTADYFDIKIDGYIATAGTENVLSACFQQFISNYCSAVTRDPTGDLQGINDTVANTGGLKTRGIDVSAGYRMKLGASLFGEETGLSFNFNGTRTLEYTYVPVVGLPIVNECEGKFGAVCGEPLPKWKHSLRTTLTAGAFTGSVQWRYFGSVNDDDPTTTYFLEHAKAQNYFDLTAAFDVADHFTISGGVDNVFDKKPPLSASVQQFGNGEQSNTYPSSYDVLGRFFHVGVTAKF